jgi:Protein of unknown function (DUF1553)/Protein of unknown function (DUF1549)/Planctomycete cytochrome C
MARFGWKQPGALFAALALAAAAVQAAPGAQPSISFNRDVRPILSDQCFFCHGFDAKKRKGDLRLDVPAGAFTPDKDGKVAVKPGDLAHSELWRRINTTDKDDVMPPSNSHKTITDAQRDTLKRWILAGAPYQKHWAFEAPVKATPPQVSRPEWCRNPVDRFILARLDAERLKPSPEADRATLIRRVTFDLTGLPPTPAEVDAFLSDKSRDAYDKVVNRLLNSPRFGERMAQGWLDLARYADTHGLHLDNERQMWAYRDWVVRAFNNNEPFDQFTIDQLAGDLLPHASRDQITATGFSRCNVTTGEGGSIDAELLFRYAVDRAATTLQTWTGLTAGCSVCHDHKFDPITSKEFYSVYAFFYSNADPAMDGNILTTPPFLKFRSDNDQVRLAEFDDRIETARKRIDYAFQRLDYSDPASLNPPPLPRNVDQVWLDDGPPSGWKSSSNPTWRSKSEGPVKAGEKALHREGAGLVQDVFEGPAVTVPQGAKFYVHVFIDPANPPRTIMLQFKTDGWEHRVLWGDNDAIDWGGKEGPAHKNLGPLPKAGEWVLLEFEPGAAGLKPDEQISGLAYTQFGGSVTWDLAGARGVIDPVNDTSRSFAAWVRTHDGKDDGGLPDDVRRILKDTPADKRNADQNRRLREHYLENVCADTTPTFAPLRARVDALRKERDEYEGAIPGTFVWNDLDKPREAHQMLRGQYDKPGDVVHPGVPAVFPPIVNRSNPNRLDLANWLVSREHPLTARVAVNRYWQQVFGTGLVKTSYDFGSQGEQPTHPELLDWLAVTYREIGWDTKEMLRMLVTSATYRQSSVIDPEVLKKDPENRLYARGARFRLDAEEIRDNALFVSGLIVDKFGGRAVKTYQPPNIWEPVGYADSNTRFYKQDHGDALYRRSLYVFLKRTAPAPFLTSFDAPSREGFCARRERSDTPLQALLLLNDTQHFEAARALAQRVLESSGKSFEDRVDRLYRIVLARRPKPSEGAVLWDAFKSRLERYRESPAGAEAVLANGESAPAPLPDKAEFAAWTLVANTVLNLDETLTRN